MGLRTANAPPRAAGIRQTGAVQQQAPRDRGSPERSENSTGGHELSVINVVAEAVRRSATRGLQLGRWRGVERGESLHARGGRPVRRGVRYRLGLAAIRSRALLRKVSRRPRGREGAGRCRSAAGTAGVGPRLGVAPPGRVPRRGGRRSDDEASRTAKRDVDAGPTAACHRDVPGVVGVCVLGY